MIKDLGFVLSWLLPPPPENDHEHTVKEYNWQVSVTVGLIVTAFGVAFHVAWACGLLISLGLPGFARADQLRQNENELTEVRVAILDAQIYQTRKDQCMAIQLNNPAARAYMTERLQERLALYQAKTGRTYRLPACDEL